MRRSTDGPCQAWARASELSLSESAFELSPTTSPGTARPAAASSDDGAVGAGNSAATALMSDRLEAARTAVPAPMAWPAVASFSGCTLMLPGPRRTPVMMSSTVPRSVASPRCEGTGPRSVSGAAATMPQDAKCFSVSV